jgi:tellurite resistance protein TerC
VPAIFALTADPFIVYTSNVFAILGLRALFFVLAGIMGLFRYLKVGLSLVLVFVGAKMLISEIYKIPIGVSLAVVAAVLAGSVLASLVVRPRAAPALPRMAGSYADMEDETGGPAVAEPVRVAVRAEHQD